MRVAVALAFAAVLVAFFALGGHRYVSFETVKANRDALLAYTQAHEAQAMAVAFVVFTAATAFSVPGGLLFPLTCGFLFGRWTGTVIVVCAGTIGATLLFLVTRYVAADAVRKWLGARGDRINAGFTRHGFGYMLFLRLVPFPFFLVNLAPALTSLPLRTYVAATFIGVIPGMFVFANLGEALGRVDSLQDLVSWETFGALALLGVLALVPIGVREMFRRRARRTNEAR
jgi:uncharacterized membrane protein YdjX (TVP38/TMEM64 family)